MGDTNEQFVDFCFRKPTVHSITRVYCISMNIIVILRAADLYSSMKIRPIIERLTHQSNRKRDELAFLHRALRIYIISNKLPRVQGETPSKRLFRFEKIRVLEFHIYFLFDSDTQWPYHLLAIVSLPSLIQPNRNKLIGSKEKTNYVNQVSIGNIPVAQQHHDWLPLYNTWF